MNIGGDDGPVWEGQQGRSDVASRGRPRLKWLISFGLWAVKDRSAGKGGRACIRARTRRPLVCLVRIFTFLNN